MRWLLALLIALSLTAAASAQKEPAGPQTVGPRGDLRLTAVLDEMVAQTGVPAMGVVLVQRGQPIRLAVSGVRKHGENTLVTTDDQWHFGSNTKAMTATMIGVLVDKGKLRWDSTLGEIFPELALMHPAWKPVTVDQVLAHRSGAPANLEWNSFDPAEPLMQQRAEAMVTLVREKPEYEPGSKAVYANTNYVIAGAIIEKVMGEEFERVIRAEVFRPLRMRQMGFGGTGTVGKVDQPWPHLAADQPAESNGPEMDNPAIMAPAGTAHGSLIDYGRFLESHLDAGRSGGALLKADTYAHLHTAPFGDQYALGWLVAKRRWGGRVLTHAGSNTMNFVVTWVAPDRDLAVAVVINQGGEDAANAANETAWKVLQTVLPAEVLTPPTPTPTPSPSPTPTPTASPSPSPSPEATKVAPATGAPTRPKPTPKVPRPRPAATAAPAASPTPAAAASPAPTGTPAPAASPAVAPTATPKPKATARPKATPRPKPATAPAASPTPAAAASPAPTGTPAPAASPAVAPTATPKPKATTRPKATPRPKPATTPAASPTPATTPTPAG